MSKGTRRRQLLQRYDLVTSQETPMPSRSGHTLALSGASARVFSHCRNSPSVCPLNSGPWILRVLFWSMSFPSSFRQETAASFCSKLAGEKEAYTDFFFTNQLLTRGGFLSFQRAPNIIL